MQIIEQRKLLDDLKKYRSKMTRDDQYHYDMFMKRQKDDEELDLISLSALQNLHKKYVKKMSREEAEKLFKKF